MKKRLFSLLLAVVLVLGSLPLSAFATETEVSVTLRGLHSAQVSSMKLYTYADYADGTCTTDLLDGVSAQTDPQSSYMQVYNTTLAPGDYWVEGYETEGNCRGGIKITVTADGDNVFYIQSIYQIYATNSGWVQGTDYDISVEVTNGSVTREIDLGQSDNYGTLRAACLFLLGDTVKATFTPIGDRAETAVVATVTKTPTANDYLSTKISEAVVMNFTVPAGAAVDVGKLTRTYFVYEFYAPQGDPAEGETEGTEVWSFRVPKETVSASSGPYFFYRVSDTDNADAITYWNFFAPTDYTESTVSITITEADLFIGDSDFNQDTIIRDYSQSKYDTANIYMNINNQGYLNLDEGGEYELNIFRNWQAIEHFYNRRIALPDVNYEIITLDGSDVIEIEPDAHNSGLATLKATGTGTAIVKVTYDAMYHMQAIASDSTTGATSAPAVMSATWPEFTGVFVVTVGKDGTGIDMGMTIDRAGTTAPIDAEHDFLYYTGEAGASYTFTPASGAVVTVSRGVVSDTEITFGDFTADNVTTNGDGSVTVSGLTTGRHIIRVEKGGAANYQVVTARQTSYEIQKAVTDDSGAITGYETMTAEEIAGIKANDTIYLQFSNLVNPVEKLSGVYNFNARIYYVGEDGTAHSIASGQYGEYDFSSNPERQRVAITIPKYWAGDTYSLTGMIKTQGNGSSAPAHRGVRYGVGITTNYDSPSVGGMVSRMPELTFSLAPTDFLTGTLNFVDANSAAITADLTVTMEDADGNTVNVQKTENGSYTFECVAGAYSFIITGAGVEYHTGSVTVTEDGGNSFDVTLTTTASAAWDGVTVTEPAQVDGVYQISTGAELAWFVTQSNSNKTAISGELMADIDLAKYPWMATLTYASYATMLEGNGHAIKGLSATRGLFGALGANSSVRDLTIYGTISGGNQAGSVVGYTNGAGTVIENIVNYASVSGTSATGGIVGTNYPAVTIRNCANHGVITTTGGNVGGIIGSTGQASITGCYNTADITGGAAVGGIFGGSGYAATIIGCYNTGNIAGTNNIGGVGGSFSGPSYGSGTATLRDCYSTGAVSATNTNVGGALGYYASAKATLERVYHLGTDEDTTKGEALTGTELKDAQLDPDYFGGTCDGYPALLWQTDVTFHRDTDPVVTAPNCTEQGYTTYTCGSCGAWYVKDYTDPLGHDWCDHADRDEICTGCAYTAPTCVEEGSIVRDCRFEGCEELKTDVLPATGHTEDVNKTEDHGLYKDCVCAVCEEPYRVWDDARLQYMTLDVSVLSDISFEDNTYPWAYNAVTGRMESTCQGVNSGVSQSALTVTLSGAATVSFDYGVSSESRYDKLTISALIGGNTVTIADAISGTSQSSFTYDLPAGTYTLTFKYAKDSSGNTGSDVGWFDNLTVAAPETYTVTLPGETTGYTVTATEGSETTVTAGGSFAFTVEIAEGYIRSESFAVKAGDTVLEAQADGSYLIENITADVAVTVEGVEEAPADYELRVLTFEDADYKGDQNYAGGSDWSTLIDTEQYNGALLYPSGATEAYNWYDKDNTELSHVLPNGWGDNAYWGGGHAVSHYASGDVETYGNFNYQLTVYKAGTDGMVTTGGGHNGSDNFAMHYGYVDDSGYSSTVLPTLIFGDGVARVIDHMYVNNSTYAIGCYVSGNDLTAAIGENDWVKAVATGYAEDGTTTTAEIYLCNGPENIVMDWTKWDLSGLGAVTKVEFNITGSVENGYGNSMPAYFAYDDVAVRFEKESADSEPIFGTEPLHNLSLQDLIKIGYAFIIDAPDATERGVVIVTGDSYTEGMDITVDTENAQVKALTASGSYWTTQTDGIYSQRLDTVHYARPYVVIDGEYIYGDVDEYSVPEYAATVFAQDGKEELKQCMVDLLNYGAAAQVYLAELNGTDVPDTLINDMLSDEQKVIGWNGDLKQYAPTLTKDTAGDLDAAWSGSNLSLLEAICLNLASTGDVDGMYYWTAEDYEAAEVLDSTTASGILTVKASGSYSIGTISGIAAKNIADVCYVCAYNDAGTCGPVRADSVAIYATKLVDSKADGSAASNTAKALLVYGASAKVYLESLNNT